MKRRQLYFLLFTLFIGLVLIVLWLKHIPFHVLMEQMQAIKPGWVLLSAGIYLAAYFVRSLRWRLILKGTVQIGVWESWLYSMAGNLTNYLIPIRAGELLKSWFIRQHHQKSIAVSLPTVFIDKSFDTLAIVALLLILPFLAIQISLSLGTLLALLFGVFLLSIGILIFAAVQPQKSLIVLQKFFFWLPKKLQAKLDDYLKLFVEGLNIFRHSPRVLYICVAFTAVGLLLDGLYFYLLFLAFGVQLPFFKVLFGYTLINLSYALPQPPAQLGSNQWMMIVIFSLGFGLTKFEASAIMAFAHVLTAILILATGALGFATMGTGALKMIFKGESIDAKHT